MTSVRYVGAGFRACTKPFVTDVCVGQALPARLWGECLHGEAACGMTIRSAANALWFARPSNRLVERFDAATALASERTQALEEQSEPLAALRDTLLPKLISGELRVNDAEKAIEVTA